MPRHPIADHGREFSDLEIDPRIIEWRVAKKIFVGASFRPFIGGIETAIDPRLHEEINVTRPLRVEEDRQSRIEEPLIAREDQSRRRLIEVIRFKIDKSA